MQPERQKPWIIFFSLVLGSCLSSNTALVFYQLVKSIAPPPRQKGVKKVF